MIGPDQVVNGVTIGLILVLLGLVPGLYQAIEDGLANCASLLSLRFAFLARTSTELKQPRWFAAVGAFLIALTFLAYIAK
jgi:hypothetical protein